MAFSGAGPFAFANRGIPVAIQSQVGTFLHLHGGNAQNGAEISTWSWVDQPNLKWLIESVPNQPNLFYIVSCCNRAFVLHQHGNTQNNDGKCTTWSRQEAPNSPNTWVYFEPSGDGAWFIKFAHSHKCVHVHGGSSANDTPITQWEQVNQPNLKWNFHPVSEGQHQFNMTPGSPHAMSFAPMNVAIQSEVGTFMHLHGGHAQNGADITAWSWVDQPNLKWHIEQVPNQQFFYIVSACDPAFVLHQHGNTQNNDGKCTTWSRREAPNSPNTWVYFEPAGNGWWFIKFAHSHKCAHVHGGSSANDTPITQWEQVNQPNLKWRFLPVN